MISPDIFRESTVWSDHTFYTADDCFLLLETNQVAGTERRLQPARVRKKMRNLSEFESSAITTWTHAVITIYIQLGQLRLNPPGLGSKCGKRVERLGDV